MRNLTERLFIDIQIIKIISAFDSLNDLSESAYSNMSSRRKIETVVFVRHY